MSFANGLVKSEYSSNYSYKKQWYERNRERSIALMKKYNEEHKEQIKESKRIHHQRTYLKKGRHGIKNNHYIVKQYDLETGELLDTYDSIYEASEDNGINLKTIRYAVNKNNGISPRLGWRWEIFKPDEVG